MPATAYKNPLEAEQALTTAFGPTTPEQYAAIKQASSLVPTVISSTTINDKVVPEAQDKLRKYTGANAAGQKGTWNTNLDPKSSNYGIGEFTPAENDTKYLGIDGKEYWSSTGMPVGGSTPISPPTTSPEEQEVQSLFEQMKSTNDAAFARQLDAIRNQYSNLKRKQEDINMRQQKSVETTLLMGGSSRYAPISSSSLEAQQANYGIQQLQQLTDMENTSIGAAQAAYDTGNYRLLEKQLEVVEKRRAEKQAATQELSNLLAKQNSELIEKSKRMAQEDVLIENVGNGITDVGALARASGMTLAEASESLKLLTIQGINAADVKSDFDTFQYWKTAGKLPTKIAELPESEQYFAWLNMNKLADSGKLGQAAGLYGGGVSGGGGGVVGAGAKNSTEEQIIRTRLFAKLSTILNKGTLSDTDRKIIDERIAQFRNAGLSEQEIMSRLAGFPADVNTPYNESFISLAAANTATNEQQQVLMGKVGQLLAAGNYKAAMDVLERKAMENTDNYGKDDYVGLDDVSYIKEKTNGIEKLLGEGWANEVGLFTGSISLWLSQRFGVGQAAKIKAQLGSLTASLINKRAGSAITEEEWKRLIEPNIPKMGDSAKTWVTKINELYNDALVRLNTERSLVSLPSLTIDEVTDPQKRLQLYSGAVGEGIQDDPLRVFGGAETTEDNPLGI